MNQESWQDGMNQQPTEQVDLLDSSATSADVSATSFSDLSSRLEDNLASATLRLVDAAQDFAGMIRTYVAAGQALEEKIAALHEVTVASQLALTESRQAAVEAQAAAKEAQSAQQKSTDLIRMAATEHVALVELTDSLRRRIAALAVLGEPFEREELPENVVAGPGSEAWMESA